MNHSCLAKRFLAFVALSLLSALHVAVLSPLASASSAEVDREERVRVAQDYRAFLSSRTSAERKVPKSVVRQWRADAASLNAARGQSNFVSQGEPVPTNLRTLYRIEGKDSAAITRLIASLGASPTFISSRRPYITANLTIAEVMVLAEDEAVTRVREVIGPKAKGNAAVAHDINGLPQDASATDGPLTGEGVVIGLISLPFSSDLLTALEGAGAVPTEASGKLVVLNGAKVVCNSAADPDPCEGVTPDALNMLQVVHGIAPNATIVVGSPGSLSTPGQMASVIDSMVAGSTAQAADIVFDDLYYPTQNPFELDEVSEAITGARNAGVLYLTAAGDGGHDAESGSTSSVYVSDVEGVSADGTPAQTLDDFWGAADTIHNFGGATLVTTSESLADICMFSDQNPGASGTGLTAFVYDDSDALVGSIDDYGCLSEDSVGVTALPLPAQSSVIVLVNSATGSSRFMLTTERHAPPADLVYTSPTLSLTTAGNILGHAYAPDAIAVAAADLCIDGNDAVQNYSDETACPTVSVAPFSADGEGDQVARFFWEMSDQSSWEAIESGLAVSTPFVTAVGGELVQIWNGTQLVAGTYRGTSASVAVASGIAALYWEYRVITQSDTGVLSAELVAALRDSTRDAGLTGSDVLFGYGVVDAALAFEASNNLFDQPLAAQNLTLTSMVGGVELSFDKALDDVADPQVFEYNTTCGTSAGDGSLLSATLYPSDAAGGLPNDTKVPKFIAAAGDVFCTVTPRKDSTSQTYAPSALSVNETAGAIPSVSATMVPKAGGASFSFAPSSLEATQDVTYSASCTANNATYTGPDWASNPNDVDSATPYALQGTAGTVFSCSVTASVESGGTTYTSEPATASATATAIGAATATFRADAGGIAVSWIPDPNLASIDMASGTVVCMNSATGLQVVSQALTGPSAFIEAEVGITLDCYVSTVISINGVPQAATSTTSVSVTPEEEVSSGLPIWLLYQATQGSQAAP